MTPHNLLEETLLKAMEEKLPDGGPRFAREEVRDAIAFLLLTHEMPAQPRISGEVLQLLGAFSIALGAPLARPGELQSKLETYFAAHPTNHELLTRVARVLR